MQLAASQRGGQSRAYAIEAAGLTAGVVVHDGHGFHFFTADERFGALDGAVFRTVAEATRAAERLAARRPFQVIDGRDRAWRFVRDPAGRA